ncbi:MAG: hypothetical protein NWP80_01005 [Candidatus Gracilibacteria bacterium]|nr:hypothetical protein [Candidatus Gracilibacteria bacterium]
MNNELFESLLIKASNYNTPFSTLSDINNLISDSVNKKNNEISKKFFYYIIAIKGQEYIIDYKEIFLLLIDEIEITSIENSFFKEFLSRREKNVH